MEGSALAPKLDAPQHRPRPLPLFLAMLRRETEGAPERLAGALAGLRRYQEAPRPAPAAPPEAVAELMGAKVRDYGGAGPPVLFVPSLINPPSILDLPERSLLRWLAAEGGVRPLLLDWGWEVEARSALSVAGHVEEVLLPLIATLGEAPALVGYCLGGTMALAAAGPSRAPAVAAIAAPWRFAGFPDEARADARAVVGRRGGDIAGARLPADGGAAERLLEPRSGADGGQVRGLRRHGGGERRGAGVRHPGGLGQ